MANTVLSAALLLVLCLVTNVSAFWRMECRAELGYERIDPIISPGEPSSHVHVMFGAQNFGFSSTYETLINASCTSCIVTEDRSVYWSPSLYFMGEDGTFTLVPNVGGMLPYYFLNGENITAFPEGFAMVSGDSFRRNFSLPVPDPPQSFWTAADMTQEALAQKALGFNCLNYDKAPEGSLYRHTMPNKTFMDENCLDGMRFEVMFPSCWNGEDVNPPDHKSHMAFPDLVMDGDCPPGFDIRLPSLFYETIWDTYAFVNQSGEFVLANGDPTGNGYHGDFMMGWNEAYLQDVVNTCTNLSGMVEDCPLFTLQSTEVATGCTLDIPAALRSENVTGPRQGLPGNVKVTYGPEPANEDPGNSPSSASVSISSPIKSTQSAAGYSPAKSSGPGLGGVLGGTTTSSIAATTSPSPTSPPTASVPANEPIYTTTYTTNGEIVHLLVFEEEIMDTVTITATPTAAIKPRENRHVHRHLHGRANF